MDSAAIVVEINEHIQRLQDLNRQMGDISKKIGVLQEEGRALHSAALEVKGAIEALAKMKAKEDEKIAKSETAKLTLPEGVQPVVAESVPAGEAPKAETLAAPTLEVVK